MTLCVLLRDESIDSTEVHLDSGLIILQQLQFLLQFFLALLLDAFELVLIKIMSPPQSVQLMFFFVLLQLPPMQDHKPELILGVEISNLLKVLRRGNDVLEAFFEHVLN